MTEKFHIFIGHSEMSFIEQVCPLLKEQYEVSVSSKGRDILNDVLTLRPDVAILDFSIHEIDVLKLCEQLTGSTFEIDTVICVKLDELSLAKKKWRQRAFDYIIGHSDPFEFVEDINKIVRYIQTERERERLIRERIELHYCVDGNIVRIHKRVDRALKSKKWEDVRLLKDDIRAFEKEIKENRRWIS